MIICVELIDVTWSMLTCPWLWKISWLWIASLNLNFEPWYVHVDIKAVLDTKQPRNFGKVKPEAKWLSRVTFSVASGLVGILSGWWSLYFTEHSTIFWSCLWLAIDYSCWKLVEQSLRLGLFFLYRITHFWAFIL